MPFEYLLLLLFWTIIAFLLQRFYKVKLFKNFRSAFLYYLIMLLLGSVWDQFAIWRGHWSYGKGILDIYVGLMPIEDYFFIIVCSYFPIVLYKIIEAKTKK